MYRFSIVTGLLAFAVNFGGARAVAAEFDELVAHVPETANTLVLIDAQKLFGSAVAQRDNWQAKRGDRFAAGLTVIPPKAIKMVIASDLNLEQRHSNWEVVIGKTEADVSVSSLASRYGGVTDKVDSVPVVRLPDSSFVLEFPGGVFGAMTPGNRQSVSAWIARKNRGVSPYLQEGVGYAEAGAEVIMVLDLHNAFAAKEVEVGIERFKTVQNSKVDREALSKLIAGVKGVMLGITFGDKPFGEIKIDFAEDATILSDIAKPLILEVLGEYGVMIDEAADWKPEVKAQQVLLRGNLTEHGLTRLASMIPLPPALHAHAVAGQDPAAANTGGQAQAAQGQAAGGQAQAAAGTGQDEQSAGLVATQKYYESVLHFLHNLQSRKHDWKTMGQVAQWFENYGRLVDRLPTLNVDKEMLQYGRYISSQLHGASMTLKGITINRRISEMNAASSTSIYGGALGNISQDNWQQGSSYGYGGGGSFGGNYGRFRETNAAYGLAARGGIVGARNSELRQQQRAYTAVHAQSKAQGATSTQQIIQNIETACTQIRQAMTDKYQVQFPAL